jgi:hypothetical protein
MEHQAGSGDVILIAHETCYTIWWEELKARSGPSE